MIQKKLAVFLLDDPAPLCRMLGVFDALAARGIATRIWTRLEHIPAVHVLAPQTPVSPLDPRLWEAPELRPWWPAAFGEAIADAPDHVLILDRSFSRAAERLVLLFPSCRLTVALVEDWDASAFGSTADLRTIVNRQAAMLARIGLGETADWPAFPHARRHANAAMDFLLGEGFGAGEYLLVDLADMAADAAEAEAFAAMLRQGLDEDMEADASTPGPFLRHVLLHDGGANANPAPLCNALLARGMAALPIDRTRLDWRVRLDLVELCSGYIGVESCEGHVAAALGRPLIVLMGGLAWRDRLPPARWGRALGCDVPQRGLSAHVARAIAKEAVAAALLDFAHDRQLAFTVQATLAMPEPALRCFAQELSPIPAALRAEAAALGIGRDLALLLDGA